MARNGSLRLGIALGAERAVAVVLGRKGAPTAGAALSLDGADDREAELGRAFEELRAGLESAGAGATEGALVHLTLLPPLADARVIPFPPMRRPEVEAVLSRDVARYFLGANQPRVVGVRLPNGNGRKNGKSDGGSVSVFTAAAHLAVLEAARRALEKVGWRPVSFSAAHGGWHRASAGSKGTPLTGIVAVVGETAHLIRLEGPNPVAARQVPARDPAAVAEALGPGPGRILVLCSPQTFEALAEGMAGTGRTLVRDPEGWAGAEESAAARADAATLELVPPTLAEERREKARRYAGGLVAAAVVLVLAAAGAQLWGAHRELGALEARRAEIRSQVAPLLATRDSVNLLTAQVQAMEELEASSPVWTRSLVELAAVLPQDTYLTALFASGDTLEIEAAGARAGEAIQALRESGLFAEVRLQGLVERELNEGETVVERFRLWALLPPKGEGVGS